MGSGKSEDPKQVADKRRVRRFCMAAMSVLKIPVSVGRGDGSSHGIALSEYRGFVGIMNSQLARSSWGNFSSIFATGQDNVQLARLPRYRQVD